MFEAAAQSCSCFSSCSPKLRHKAVTQSRSPKLLSRAAPNSCSPKLLKLPSKVASKSSFPKLLSQATQAKPWIFKAIVRQCCCNAAKLLPTVVPQSCPPKLLPKAASQRSFPKQRAQAKEASTVCAVEGACSKRAVLQRCV